jgi:hypothetical protein
MPSFISIGCECGGPEARIVAERKAPLYQAISRAVSSTYCSAIDEYALVLRVDGSLATYGEEGVANIRFAKKRRVITADLQVPELAWKPLNPYELNNYLARMVLLGLQGCTARLKRDGHQVQSSLLMAEAEQGVAEYMQEHGRRKLSDA